MVPRSGIFIKLEIELAIWIPRARLCAFSRYPFCCSVTICSWVVDGEMLNLRAISRSVGAIPFFDIIILM